MFALNPQQTKHAAPQKSYVNFRNVLFHFDNV